MSPIAIITGVIGLIKFLTSGVRLNEEAQVASAIKAVERKTGLTDDVKWAWAWFDKRYPELDLGDSWKGYCYYADVLIKPWYDLQHWKDVSGRCLEEISFYLQEAITKWEAEHPGDIGYELQPWYLKYLPYGIMAGLGTALIISLTRPRRK